MIKLSTRQTHFLTWVINTFQRFFQDRCPMFAASIAFYTVFSFAPILIIILFIAANILGSPTAYGEIFNYLHNLVGTKAALSIEHIVQHAHLQRQSANTTTFISTISLLISTSATFSALDSAFSIIWPISKQAHSNLKNIFRIRLISFALILGISLLLVFLSIFSMVLSLINHYLLFNATLLNLTNVINAIFSFVILSIAFAAIIKFLPHTKIHIQNAFIGGSISAALFLLGKKILILYLLNTKATNIFGAAGSFVALLIWFYFSAAVLLLGAEFAATWRTKKNA